MSERREELISQGAPLRAAQDQEGAPLRAAQDQEGAPLRAAQDQEGAPLRAPTERARASELGRLRAEALEHELRQAEQREREARLALLAWNADGDPPPAELEPRAAGAAGAGEVWRLQQEVERLAAFHHAVLSSRSWRLLQALRRPFGRAW
jgi:hypothetical protein